jgi:hypothetical protein
MASSLISHVVCMHACFISLSAHGQCVASIQHNTYVTIRACMPRQKTMHKRLLYDGTSTCVVRRQSVEVAYAAVIYNPSVRTRRHEPRSSWPLYVSRRWVESARAFLQSIIRAGTARTDNWVFIHVQSDESSVACVGVGRVTCAAIHSWNLQLAAIESVIDRC